MGWMQKLYETYERCSDSDVEGVKSLLPIAHTTQQAHIEVTIDPFGQFRRACILPKESSTTLIPCTEKSSGRAGSKPINHPLCDKLQYIAGDFCKYGGVVTSGYLSSPLDPFNLYIADLTAWSQSRNAHPYVIAILSYVARQSVVSDLVKSKLIPLNDKSEFLTEWKNENSIEQPEIFKVISNPSDSFVRWRIETNGILSSATWENKELINAWIEYYTNSQQSKGLCYIQGTETSLAEQHQSKIRNDGDKAKLVSANDSTGFTFRGRFILADEACGIGYNVTQKSHNALKWLIRRQGYSTGGKDPQVFVAWTAACDEIPYPWLSSKDLIGDVGQSFALRLNNAITGFKSNLSGTEDIQVLGLDSATPGRLAITYYKEIKSSEFLERIKQWHESLAWPQKFGKDLVFIGAPAPRDMAEMAYGRRLDDKLKKSTIERIIPCIIEGRKIPQDILNSVIHRTFNRMGLDEWEWEKCLGVACSLFKGFYIERRYSMALEEERATRDYLYGRLLAVAEHLESRALYIAGEKNRDTMASRLMQRFADRPHATWRTIELSLTPYKARLRSNRGAFLFEMDQLIDQLLNMFSTNDQQESFLNDRPLSGEFLLGYHCQRQVLRNGGKEDGGEALEK